jgi:MFS family permease
MTIEAAAPAPNANPLHGAIVPLVALVVVVNYVDRGNLATAAPFIKDELGLSATAFGTLLSAFFWSYTPSQILAGWLCARINPYRTLALGVGVWSIATAASGLATGFASLLALRILLGIGESAAFPSLGKLLAQHLPASKLGAANGLSLTGLGLGPALGTFVGGLLIVQLGWRPVFVLFGLISLLWLLPWWAATREASARVTQTVRAPEPSYLAIMRCRAVWGASVGHFCLNYGFYFVISWLPLYLVKARGLSPGHMAEIGGLVYLVFAATICGAGLFGDHLVRAGLRLGAVRKTGIVAGLTVAAASLMAVAFGDVGQSIASLFVAAIAFGVATPSLYASSQTLAGPHAAGKWIAFENCIANIAGILAPLITGMVVDRTGMFLWAFAVAAMVSLGGALSWGLIVGPIAPVRAFSAKASSSIS